MNSSRFSLFDSTMIASSLWHQACDRSSQGKGFCCGPLCWRASLGFTEKGRKDRRTFQPWVYVTLGLTKLQHLCREWLDLSWDMSSTLGQVEEVILTWYLWPSLEHWLITHCRSDKGCSPWQWARFLNLKEKSVFLVSKNILQGYHWISLVHDPAP